MARRNSLLLLAVLFLAGCVVKPSIVPPPKHPLTGGKVLDLGPTGSDGAPLGPARVDKEWIESYDWLASHGYGRNFVPPIGPDDGVTARADGTYSVDLEHLSDKNVMAGLERSGIAP